MMKLLHGDSMDVLKTFDSNFFDSVVTDPPYDLTSAKRNVPAPTNDTPHSRHRMGVNGDVGMSDHGRKPVGGFMGKAWDGTGIAFDPAFWREVFRVLKPGAHLLAFGGTRTSHRMVCAIEDAGFEIRDSLQWLYGCLSSDSQILTNEGWKDYVQLVPGELVLGYDIETKKFTWQPVLEIVEYDYEDTAYRIQSDSTDQLVSRNHRVIVERGGRETFAYAETCELQESVPVLESVYELLRSVSLHEQIPSAQEPDMLEEMQWGVNKQIEEGQVLDGALHLSVLREGVQAEVSQEARRSSEALFVCLQGQGEEREAGISSTHEANIGVRHCSANPGSEFAEVFEDGKESRVEGRRDLLSQEGQLRGSEIREMPERVFADGAEGWVCDGAPIDHGEYVRVPANANGMCESYQPESQGQRGNEFGTIPNERRPQTRGSGSVHRGGSQSFVTKSLATITTEFYVGKVWCVRVPSGAFVARRNGMAFITGNSGFPKSLDVSKATQKVLQDRYGNKTCTCLAENEMDAGIGCSSGEDNGCGVGATDRIQRIGSRSEKEGVGDSKPPFDISGGSNALFELRQEHTSETKGLQEIEEAVLLEGLREHGAKEAGLGNASLRAGMEEHASNDTDAGQSVQGVSKNTGRKWERTSRSSPETVPIQRNESSEKLSGSLRQLPSYNRIGNDTSVRLDTDKSFPRKIILDDYAGEQDAMAWVCSWCGLPDSEWLKSLEPLGTALKPAVEPICLARKPLSEKTIAKNVLRWGTGGLNIDGSRIGEVGYPKSEHFKNPSVTAYGDGLNGGAGVATPGGRWPANVLLSHSPECVLRGTKKVKSHNPDNKKPTGSDGAIYSGFGDLAPEQKRGYADEDGSETVEAYDCATDCPVRMLDEQTGVRKSGAAVTGKEPSMTGESGIYGPFERVAYASKNDTGGASRFFYVAKSSRSERNEGLAGTSDRPGIALPQRDASREAGKPGGENPRNRGAKEVQNFHPTVKPVELMRYLVRLVTPPGGTVLDPFMGSGTTGIACETEHFSFVGIEQEEAYMEIARRRIEAVPPTLFGGDA